MQCFGINNFATTVSRDPTVCYVATFRKNFFPFALCQAFIFSLVYMYACVVCMCGRVVCVCMHVHLCMHTRNILCVRVHVCMNMYIFLSGK